MNILDIPRTGRLGQVELHIRRDKMSSYLRRRALRAYPGYMQRARGSAEGPPQERLDFADWVKDVVDAFGEPPKKWSVTRIAREGGVHRNAIYDWMAAKVEPQRETVARFCKGLGLKYSERQPSSAGTTARPRSRRATLRGTSGGPGHLRSMKRRRPSAVSSLRLRPSRPRLRWRPRGRCWRRSRSC